MRFASLPATVGSGLFVFLFLFVLTCSLDTLLIRLKKQLDLAETAKHLAQRMSEPHEFDFTPLKRAARYLVGKNKAALRFRRQKHVDKITVFVDFDSTTLATQSRERARRVWWVRSVTIL